MERFREISELGAGGAGRVVLVEDRLRPGSRLAMKELLGNAEAEVAALNREFATLATLRHPSLVEVFELIVDRETGRVRFTMEHVDGEPFVDAIRREGPASFIPLVAEMLRALAFLHDFGLVHRDLKPQNMLVRRGPKAGHRIVLLDFGLAVARHAAAADGEPELSGTLTYLAPELFDGSAPTKRSDLYALGAMAFEAVHGKPPFAIKGDDVNAFIASVRDGRRARPKLPEGFPAKLAGWIDSLLAPDPAERPTSAIDALARLSDASGTKLPLETRDDRAARLGSGSPVGRDDEIAAARRELSPSNAPRVVWLTGDAGSGKSRIARFLAAEAVGAGWRVHTPPGVLDSSDAFLSRVRDDARSTPTLLVLDEVESAGSDVATILDRIAREPREAPVHVLAAVRPGELRNVRLRKLLADTGIVPSLARIDLAPLADAGLKAMIERATAGGSSAQARVRWLADASEGNAGAAEALLVEGVWERKGKVPVSGVLELSIKRRLDALSDEARAWMEAAAVLGDDTPEPVIGELAGLEEDAAAAAAEAIGAGLARRAGARISPDSRRVAEATRAATPPERLRELHALAATHFAAAENDVFGTNAWRLARLWRGAGETDRAIEAALGAASAAAIAKDWTGAAERYRFALSALPRRDARRGDAWLKLADTLRLATRHPAAAKAYGWAARHAKDEGTRALARARRARALFSAGQLEAAERAASAIVADDPAGRLGDSEALAFVTMAHARMQRNDFRGAFEVAGRATISAGEIPVDVRAEALLLAAASGWRLNEPGSDARCRDAESLARDNDSPDTLLLILFTRAWNEERSGKFDALERTLRDAASISARLQRPESTIRASYQNARMQLLTGRFDKAAAGALAAEELARYTAKPLVGITAAAVRCEALLDAGRAAEAASVITIAIETAMPGTPELWLRAARLALARALLETGGSADEIRSLLDGTLSAFRAKGALLLLDALVTELMWRGHPSCQDPLPPIIQESTALLESEAENLRQHPSLVLRLALARAYSSLGRYRDVVTVLAPVRPAEGAPVAPILYARALFATADAFDALGDPEEAAPRRIEGGELIHLAAQRIEDADWRRDFLDQPEVRRMLASLPKPADIRRIETLYDMIRTLNSETDPEALLESILEMAMSAVEAERGMILLSGRGANEFSVRLSKNLEQETRTDVEAVSRRIVAQAEAGESILALDAGQDARFKEFKSVNLFRIRSLMCVPLRSRGKIVGTVYLDSRRQGKPFSRDDLRFVEAFADHAALALENARRRAELEAENRRLRAVVGERSSYGKIVGRSPAMQKVFDVLERIAASDVTVLIQGESGTGKELVARALHFNGPRKDRVFVSENCAALPETLLESELFGHVKGAFTGAERDRAGLFEHAHQGTLFLDEVGDMSPAMQARLLRVLQEGELRRVGGDQAIKVDVRVIAATNKDLQGEVAAGRFREDLYYRLAVVPVQLPPLRERIGDVPLLAGHLLEMIASARNRGAPRIDGDVLDALERYPWPGNVRQLENALRRVILLAGDATITRAILEADSDLARMLFGTPAATGPILSMVKTEEEQIRRALDAAGGNRDRAARLLGISRATIYRKMREFSLR